MDNSIELTNVIIEVVDVFGKKVRITKSYWRRIKTDKHKELKFEHQDVKITLVQPDEVYLSVRDSYIKLFFKKFDRQTLVVVVKYLDGDGFIVTVYQTSKVKRKGEKLWPK